MSACPATPEPINQMAKPIPICPRCGQPATRCETPTGLKNRCEPCGLWSRGSKPLRDEAGHLAERDRITARRNAHAVFDRLWLEGHLQREVAYVWLAQELGIERDLCHMSLMDTETAQHALKAAKAIRASLEKTIK